MHAAPLAARTGRPRPELDDLLTVLEREGEAAAGNLVARIAAERATSFLQNRAAEGDLTLVRLLVEHAALAKGATTGALERAAEAGHRDVVVFLIPHSNPRANDSDALHRAAVKGHLEVVRALLPVSNAQAGHSRALQTAAQLGLDDIVDVLLPASDPTAENSAVLMAAINDWDWAMARKLLPFPHRAGPLGWALAETLSTDRASSAPKTAFLTDLLGRCPPQAVDAAARTLQDRGLFPLADVLATRVSRTALMELSRRAPAMLAEMPAWRGRCEEVALRAALPAAKAARKRMRL